MIKPSLCAMAVILFASTTFAQTIAENWREGTNTVRGLLSSSRGSENVGIDYERRMGHAGLGLFVISSEENDDTAKSEQTFVGAQAVIHLLDNTEFDVYMAPGITVVMHDTPPNGVGGDETSFGPSLRLGTIYYFTKNWGLGFDWLTATNWFNDDADQQEELASLAISYTY